MSETKLEELAKMHKGASTELEKAQIEDQIRHTCYPIMRARDLVPILGGTSYEYETRARLLSSKMGGVWRVIDGGMSIGGAYAVVRRARMMKRRDKSSPDEAFERALSWIEQNFVRRNSKGGFFYTKKGDAESKDAWKALTEAARHLVKVELGSADQALADRVLADLTVELDVLTRRCKADIRASIQIEEGLKEQATPKEIREACDILQIKRPTKSRGVDMDKAKRMYRRLSGEYHPDRNPGNGHVAGLFQKIQKAYEILKSEAERKRA